LPLLSLLLLGIGCKASKPSELDCHPVSGQVIYDGRPAQGVQVFLMPTDAPTVPQIPANPHGVTGSDGRFTLETFGNSDGAPVGGYRVVLVWPKKTDTTSEDSEEKDVDRLQGWYDSLHSRVTFRVNEGPNEIPVIRIAAITKPAGHSEGIPGRN